MRIDLNCDLGEGGRLDAQIMQYITSVNVACGAHAGDLAKMRETAALARRHGVSIGAHPAYADRAGFGRTEIAMAPKDVVGLVANQIRELQRIAAVTHVKPHGALYNLAARDRVTAEAVVDAVQGVDRSLVIFALAGSELVRAARARGLNVAEEVFADRRYESDGSLMARSHPDAVIADDAEAVNQVLRMVRFGTVQGRDGAEVRVRADTVCLHGDNPHALVFGQRLRRELYAGGVEVKSYRD